MNKSSDIKSFKDFWPQYLKDHSDPASRAFHFLGLVLSIALAAGLLACGMIFFLVLAIVPAQLGAFIGHKLSPRHDRSVADDHPDWAAIADLKMFGLFLTGKLDAELEKHELPSVPSRPSFSAL